MERERYNHKSLEGVCVWVCIAEVFLVRGRTVKLSRVECRKDNGEKRKEDKKVYLS